MFPLLCLVTVCVVNVKQILLAVMNQGFFSRDSVELKSVCYVIFVDVAYGIHLCWWKVTHLCFFLKNVFPE